MLSRLVKVLSSLRLTVALLACGIVLVFLGTLAQEPMGLYLVQERFFKAFFVDQISLNAAIRKAVCDILEGGEAAFRERARRLRVRLDR